MDIFVLSHAVGRKMQNCVLCVVVNCFNNNKLKISFCSLVNYIITLHYQHRQHPVTDLTPWPVVVWTVL